VPRPPLAVPKRRAHRHRRPRPLLALPRRRRGAPRHLAVPPATATRGRPSLRLAPGPVGLLVAGAVLLVGSGALGAGPQLVLHDGAAPAAAAVPVPAAPVTQPAVIEDLSPYEPQVSCNPVAMPGAVRLGDLLRATYPGTSYGVARACWSDGLTSEHYEGRAVDWMISGRDPAQAARARAVLDWLLRPDARGRPYANARRLGVMYLIWNDHIWGAYRAGEGWRPYSTCAAHPERSSDTTCHRDHIHISLSWAGATGSTSFWTGHVAPVDYGPCVPVDLNWAAPYSGSRGVPCPPHRAVTAPPGSSPATAALYRAAGARLAPGAQGPLVGALQRSLALAVDGDFGPRTAAAVSAFRSAHRLGAASVVDASTWRQLLAAAADGALPPDGPAPAPRPAPSPSPVAPGGTAAGSTPGTLAPYAALVLRYGDSGPAVKAVQKLLNVTPTGWFGPLTQASVRAFQRAHAVPTTGNVGPLTWSKLALLT
jgi:peptidoglycan hydrolase-like protein with peptidoglycan-binding domain